MERLADQIKTTTVEPGGLAIFWIGQAGFVYKTPAGGVIYVDPYLTDFVARALPHIGYGFKRITGCPIEAGEVDADLVVSTHAHEDHLDQDAIPILLKNERIHFAGAPDCREKYQQLGVPSTRYRIIHVGQTLRVKDVDVTGVYADHGESTPHALGVLLTIGDIKVWQVGDTAYRPAQWQDIFASNVDVIVPPINGAFGNLNGVEAAQLANDAHARVAIPCHFWTFAEHGGNPAEFMDACKQFAPGVKPLLMSHGERFVYRKV
ncbi:MAG: MBL fold metallo-hydrolase [Chloroflexi bacterium]|nr:MBL fold metallo-hydrolase [Chloroflexota bacterium]